MKEAFEACERIPKMADVVKRIPEAAPKSPPWDQPARFKPMPHKCRDVGKVAANYSWRILRGLSPYEAQHVFCEAPKYLVCPNCGEKQPVFVNAFIERLMVMDVAGTKGWNPSHKGYVLCGKCAEDVGQ